MKQYNKKNQPVHNVNVTVSVLRTDFIHTAGRVYRKHGNNAHVQLSLLFWINN